jgi:hypothetical protein
MKLIASREVTVGGQNRTFRCVYIQWFVADGDEYTSRHWQRMWWMARDLIRTGVLQRWASISYLSVCEPGREAAVFERLKKFISASAPEVQLVPRPVEQTHAARP